MSLSELCTNFITKKGDATKTLDKNVIEFLEAPWGLGLGCTPDVPPLYPVQRVIIKCYYGMELDKSSDRRIIVNDKFNERELYRFNEQEYIEYLFNEGRTNRKYIDTDHPNMVLVCGRRAGKCISGDSLVLTDKGIYRIEDLGKSPEEDYTIFNIGVVQEKSKRSRSSHFYNGGIKKTYSIKTRSGYKLSGTENHRIKVLSNSGKVEWKYLNDISVGDYVAINRTTDLWAKEMVDLRKYHNKEGHKKFVLPDVLDEKIGNFIGYLVGDGSWTWTGSLSVTVEHDETWTYLEKLFKEVIGAPKKYMDKRTKNTGRIEFHSTGARKFFSDIGWELGCKRDEKMVPWSIMRSPKSVVCAFLRGLFETDGCAEGGGRYITFSSASFRLAHEVQLLLLNLGIVSSIRKKWVEATKRHYANLSIVGVRSRRIFSELIGFDSKKKRLPMLKALENATEGKSDTDSIPHQIQHARALIDSVPHAKRGSGGARMLLRKALGNVHKPGSGEDLTYTKIGKTLKVAKKLGACIDEINHFEELQKLDYFYDAVISIEEGEDHVYDLAVPDGESFVANGMTNHNTVLTSTIIAYEAYRLLNKYSPQEFYKIMPEDEIKFTCISTSSETASELFNKVTGHIERSEFFRKFRNKPSQERMRLRTQRDLDKYGRDGRSSIVIRVAPCSARGLRGPSNMVVGLDEMAHFFADEKRGENEETTGVFADRNDTAIYDAVTPSVANFKDYSTNKPEGKIICISSPGAKVGKFYEEYERSFSDESKDLFMMQAPAWEVNPNIPTQYLKNKFKENPIRFNSEFGAVFTDRLFGWIDDPQIVRQCIVPGLKCKQMSMLNVPHFMGIDIGLKTDGTAICIGHWVKELVDGVQKNLLEIDIDDWRFAKDEEKDYFDPAEIADWIASYTGKFNIVRGLADQWYGMSVIPLLEKMGHKQFEYKQFTEQLNSTVFQNLLTTMISGEVRFPEGNVRTVGDAVLRDSDLVTEILSLQATQKSKYMIKVCAPERKGMHDDRSSALARMVYLAQEYRNKGYGNKVLASSARVSGYRMMKHSMHMGASLNRPTMGQTGRYWSRGINSISNYTGR